MHNSYMSNKNHSTIAKNKDGQLVSWRHPGGKLLRLGSESLSEEELVAIIIGSGVPGKSASEIAHDLMKKFNSFRGMAGQPMEEYLAIKGLNKGKFVRIAAAFEIAKRIVTQVIEDYDKNNESI